MTEPLACIVITALDFSRLPDTSVHGMQQSWGLTMPLGGESNRLSWGPLGGERAHPCSHWPAPVFPSLFLIFWVLNSGPLH